MTIYLIVFSMFEAAVNRTAADAQYLRSACLAAAGVRDSAPNQFVSTSLTDEPRRMVKELSGRAHALISEGRSLSAN
jgi:hypothetical protein